MARIRTIKPEFFRHEGLQDLEIANHGAHVMLVFAGLWGHCDKAGRFEWRPRMLKLDILPFLAFDMEETLSLLCAAGFVRRYEAEGKQYGEVVSFEKHQRINGKEAQEPEKHPSPPDERECASRGSIWEAPKNIDDNDREIDVQNSASTEAESKPDAHSCEITEESATTRNGAGFDVVSSREAVEKQSRSQEREEEEEGKGVNLTAPASADAAPKKPAKADTPLQAACRETFRAYQDAYANRYGEKHVDNAKVRTQIKQFVERLGHDESPLVAEWFVGHPESFYVKSMHGVGVMLKDAEKLRTEWATGRVMTAGKARQSDRAGTTMAALAEVLAEQGETL